jgi:CubicO group peptidase (beta-lactamase class C family)
MQMFYLKATAATAIAIVLWAVFSGFSALNGWWLTAIAPAGNARLFMDAAVEIIETENRGNVALVLISNGEVFDEYFAGTEDDIGRDTMFSTASTSKWITANAVMHLVQQGSLDLDQPISDYLTRWQLPQSEFDNDKVTGRLLLSHMAGLADGLGFGDYEPDESVPTLEESLSMPRASGEREVEIKVGLEPGTEFKYSGGGYLLLQLLIEELSGEKFEDYVQHALLEPLGMSRSTFAYIAEWEDISRSYDTDGQTATLYRYAAKGATGFATSAGDMTRFVQSQVARGGSAYPLLSDTIKAMREPHASTMGADIWGLGTILYAPTESGDYIYGHDGQNDPAINAAVRINPDTGDALIAFVSGGQSLATALGYEWVLWQTGRPDVLHIGTVIRDVIPMFLIGSMLILVLAVAVIWRRRRNIAN